MELLDEILNNYIRKNNLYPLTEKDVKVFGEAVEHPKNARLVHHAIKDPKIVRTDFTKNMIRLAKLLDLKVASITAFTGKAGEDSAPHIDGEPGKSYSWRLSYYAKGDNTEINWWRVGPVLEHVELDLDNQREKEEDTPTGYSTIDTNKKVYTKVMDMDSAFIRTDIPHSVDMTKATEDRLTISATFFPHISWEELNERLNRL
tara:strand:- start:380 stop:988 length:609 start_codon:yes stop_codon:yes gene_type:complete